MKMHSFFHRQREMFLRLYDILNGHMSQIFVEETTKNI